MKYEFEEKEYNRPYNMTDDHLLNKKPPIIRNQTWNGLELKEQGKNTARKRINST